MSASDKKKQRKAAMADGLSQKELREQAAARAAKQKRTVYWTIGVICAVAAAALLVWNAWNSGKANRNLTAVAATVNGVDYTVADLQYYYNQARQNEIYWWQMYASYGYSYPYDPYTSDGAQWYNESENQTYADYFREQALSILKESVALCDAAKEAGYTLSDEGKETIQSNLSQIDIYRIQSGNLSRDQYLSQMYGSGVTESLYVKHLTNSILASEYQTYHADHISYEEADLKAYYEEQPNNYDSYDYRIFYVDGSASDPVDADGNPLTDADGNTVTASDEDKAAALAAAKEKVDAAVAEIQAAEDKEAAFVALAPTLVSESIKGAYEADESYSLQEGVRGSNLSSATYASWLMDSERKAGDVTSVQSSNGYNVILFLDRYLVTDPTVDMRHILITPETSDEDETNENGVQVPTAEAMEAARVKAQAILDEWKSGAATEESFAALAEEHSEDGRDSNGDLNAAGGLYERSPKGYMVSEIDQWLFDPARKAGDVELIAHNEEDGYYFGWHLVYYVGQNEPYWKYEVTQAKQENDQSDWLTAINEAATAEAADGMQYVGDSNTATPTPTEAPVESEEASPAQ